MTKINFRFFWPQIGIWTQPVRTPGFLKSPPAFFLLISYWSWINSERSCSFFIRIQLLLYFLQYIKISKISKIPNIIYYIFQIFFVENIFVNLRNILYISIFLIAFLFEFTHFFPHNYVQVPYVYIGLLADCDWEKDSACPT